jgi:hypothetical protein
MNLKTDVIVYGLEPSNSVKVFRNEDTIGYCFINSGNTPIEVNNLLLLPSAVFKTLEPGYIDKTIYRAVFKQSNNLYSSCATDRSVLTVVIYSKVQ